VNTDCNWAVISQVLAGNTESLKGTQALLEDRCWVINNL